MASPNPPSNLGESSEQELCSGFNIDYKAFVRNIYPGTGAAIICILASCLFKHTGFTIFFESGPDGLALKQSLAPGHFHWMECARAAGWCSSFAVENPPTTIEVIDSYGMHRLSVELW
jgi:hypothetical protein